ncbi:MAG: hypothetical protein JWP38_338 [Herbaspirillum sp.]|nr:hypothetical protein [Herbaspirillum sp.]
MNDKAAVPESTKNNVSPREADDADLPNERDTKPDAPGAAGPRDDIEQASRDLKLGLVDTEQRGERGIDQAVNPQTLKSTPKSPKSPQDN